jgi:hypothetical protein
MKTLLLTLLLTSACGNVTLPTTPTGGGGSAAGCTTCRIFVTAATTNGSFGSVAAGDSLCAADANKPATGTYKAMIVDETGARRACSTASCGGGASENLNWVLKPSTAYTRSDGTVIGTTGANGIFGFPLTNGFAAAGSIWTGFFFDWTTFAGATCTSWSNAGGSARYGVASTTGSTAISQSSSAGTTLFSLACVEQ